MLFILRLFTALNVLACISLAADNKDEGQDVKVSMWDRTTNLRGAFGYKDNILLSNSNPEQSAFWQTGLDFSLLRIADSGSTISLFFSGEDRRYFSAESINKEQLFLTQAKFSWEIGQNWEAGLPVNYSYIDEVFDASATEQILEPQPVISHRFSVSPYVSYKLPWESTLELKFYGDRQLLNDPLDDYWEYGPQLTWRKTYGYRSEVSLSYTYRLRPYDTKGFVTFDFEEIPGTSLIFRQHEFEFVLNHSWDEPRRWRTRTRLAYTRNEENGTGYYDYNRYRFAQRAGYYGATWQVVVEGKVLNYDYLRQPVADSGDIRNWWEYILGLRVEKNLLPKLKLFLETEHEWVDSNNPIEEYHVNTVMSGIDWEF